MMNEIEVVELTFEYRADGKRGKGTVTVLSDGKVIDSDRIDLRSAAQRERFVSRLCERQRGIDPAQAREELLQLVDQGDCGGAPDLQSQAALLIELFKDAELFHTPGSDGAAYATIDVDGHKETWAVKSKSFRAMLAGSFWKSQGKAVNAQAMQDALGVISAMARFDGQALPVAVRVASHGNAIYLDMTDPSWRAIEITADGWRVVHDPPVKFVRRNGMLPLLEPQLGGHIDDLRPFLNFGPESNWVLLVTWLLAALRPQGPYPILVVNGEQGSAKSTLCKVLRCLIDPNFSDLRAEPREINDLMIAATNAWVMAFDNLSHIRPELSDALCRISTGGGISKRMLYSDDEEKLFSVTRPLILNGIEDLATRSDLLDRCICVTLPTIPESQRRTEAQFFSEFEAARPRLLGTLLTVLSSAMKLQPHVRLEKLPRMADFALWGVAIEEALGLAPNTFITAYQGNRDSSNDLALEASAIGPVIVGLMRAHESWMGTSKDLLAALGSTDYCDDATRRRADWPRTPHKLSSDLRRLSPNLRRAGIDCSSPRRTNRGSEIILSRRH